MNLPASDLASVAWSQLWQVTVLAAVVGVAVRFGCRCRPHLAYVLWMLVVLKCLAPPLWSSPAGLFSWAQFRVAPAESEVSPSTANVALLPSDAPQVVAETPEKLPPALSSPNPVAHLSPSPSARADMPHSSQQPRFSLTMLLAAAWLAGSLGLTGLLLWRWLTYRRLFRRSAIPLDATIQSLATGLAERLRLRQKARVLVMLESVGPAVFGLLRPVVVLPQAVVAGKTPQQIEPILAHELVHIRRGDTYWSALQLAAAILWWFHPLVWWANRQTCRERERCCDEEVVAGLKCKPAAYARCLLDVLELERNWQPMLAISGSRSVNVTSKRLEDIMNRSDSFHARTPRWSWAVLAVAAALVLPGRAIVLGQGQNQSPASNEPQAIEKDTEPAKSQTTVIGQVVDSAGKVVSGAQVAVLGLVAQGASLRGDLINQSIILGLTEADGNGRFRLNVPGFSSAAYRAMQAVAVADGFSLGGQPIGLDVDRPNVTISLTPAQTIHGRVVDANREPVANAEIHVTGLSTRSTWLFPSRDEPSQRPFWPKPITTDRQGRFTLRGVDRSQVVTVQLCDERFASDQYLLAPADKIGKHVKVSPSGEVTLSPAPARVFEGEITYGNAHEPAANALVEISVENPGRGSLMTYSTADAAGRFRLNPYSGETFRITVFPPDGQPHLICEKKIKLADGQQPPKIEIALPRGVLVRGRVVEKESGRPVGGAEIMYDEYALPQYALERTIPSHSPRRPCAATKADGTFAIAVPPGFGLLLVQGPGGDFVRHAASYANFHTVNGGNLRRHYVGAAVPLDLKIDQQPAELNLAIRRGVTIRGRIVGPDNRAIGDVQMVSRHFHGFNNFMGGAVRVKDGQFELHGLDPEVCTPFYFLDAKNELGATVEISGKSAEAGPLVVHLQPCGKAVARFVDAEGRPQAKQQPVPLIVLSPARFEMAGKERREVVWSDTECISNLDNEHYGRNRLTDDDGKFTFSALIPGATYGVGMINRSVVDWNEKDFTVKSGETLQLPDITVKQN